MSKVFKLVISNYPNYGEDINVRVKPSRDSLDALKGQIFIRFPELEYRQVQIKYQHNGEHIDIFNSLDYALCRKANVSKFYVNININETVHKWSPSHYPPQKIANPTMQSSHQKDKSEQIEDEELYQCIDCNHADICLHCIYTTHATHKVARANVLEATECGKQVKSDARGAQAKLPPVLYKSAYITAKIFEEWKSIFLQLYPSTTQAYPSATPMPATATATATASATSTLATAPVPTPSTIIPDVLPTDTNNVVDLEKEGSKNQSIEPNETILVFDDVVDSDSESEMDTIRTKHTEEGNDHVVPSGFDGSPSHDWTLVEAKDVEATDEEATDVEATDDEAIDDEATDEEVTDAEATDDEAIDDEATDEEVTDAEATDDDDTDVEASDDDDTDDDDTDVEATDDDDKEVEAQDEEVTDAEATDNDDTDVETTDDETTDDEATDVEEESNDNTAGTHIDNGHSDSKIDRTASIEVQKAPSIAWKNLSILRQQLSQSKSTSSNNGMTSESKPAPQKSSKRPKQPKDDSAFCYKDKPLLALAEMDFFNDEDWLTRILDGVDKDITVAMTFLNTFDP